MYKHLVAKSWCLEKGIKIYIVPIQYRKDCYIEIDNNGKITRSPHTYPNQSEASKKIWELNIYLYEQNNEKNPNRFN